MIDKLEEINSPVHGCLNIYKSESYADKILREKINEIIDEVNKRAKE